MKLPEPHQDDDPGSNDDVTGGPGAVEKPSWLVDAHDALDVEFGRDENDPTMAPPELRAATPEPPRQPAGPRPVNPYEGFASSAAGRASSSNWMESGHATPISPQAGPQPEPEEAIDPDDPFGHGHARAEADAAAAEPAEPEAPAASTEKARWSPPPPAPKPSGEPLLARVLSVPGLIVIAVVVIGAITGAKLLGPKDHSVSLSRIHRNAASYDGQAVKVRGRVGEVYPVGGGYSFYLLQGRDTMVVFTRSRTPVTNERVSVDGVVSTGVLNGEMRQAILESAP